MRANAFGQWHACGTCKMGQDKDAVVSPENARVIGIDGLRVVDASIMPTAIRANLNIPVIMIAEKVSDLIIAQEAEANRARHNGENHAVAGQRAKMRAT